MDLSRRIPAPLTLDSILAHQFAGNAASDCPAFAQIDEWCAAPGRPAADIVAVQNHVAVEGMGLGDDCLMTIDQVPAYLADLGG